MNLNLGMVLTLIFLCFSCSRSLPYDPPKIELPQEWKTEVPLNLICDPLGEDCDWWKTFQDDRLNGLIEQVLNQNMDLSATRSRIEAADQKAIMSAAVLYPQLTFEPTYENFIALSNFFGFPSVHRFHTRIYELPFTAKYELDLFGKNYYQATADKHKAEASLESSEGIKLNLITTLVTYYFNLLAVDTQIQLLDATIHNRSQAVQTNEDLLQAELIEADSVALAKADLALAESEKIGLLRQRNDLENLIAVLCGESASSFKLDFQTLPDAPPGIPACLSSQLLMQRPDIAEAYKILQSNNALVGYAEANLYPSFSFEGQMGLEAPFAKLLFDTRARYWAIAGFMSQTIFDAGKKNANVALTKAQYEESLANFYQRILVAIQEVESSLAAIRYYDEEDQKQAVYIAQQSAALKGLLDKYQAGIIDYINPVNAENSLLYAQRGQISVQARRFIAVVQLIKALGGGWNFSENLEPVVEEPCS